jgi:hypothetical protein
MNLELSQDEALVFFEWLSRLDEQDAFPCEDPAEQQVLWSLQKQLEKVLAEPFRANYRELVEQARARVKGSQAAGSLLGLEVAFVSSVFGHCTAGFFVGGRIAIVM